MEKGKGFKTGLITAVLGSRHTWDWVWNVDCCEIFSTTDCTGIQ